MFHQIPLIEQNRLKWSGDIHFRSHAVVPRKAGLKSKRNEIAFRGDVLMDMGKIGR